MRSTMQLKIFQDILDHPPGEVFCIAKSFFDSRTPKMTFPAIKCCAGFYGFTTTSTVRDNIEVYEFVHI